MDEIKTICSLYDKYGSVKAISKELGISWNRVVKVLTSEGYVLNDNHEEIIKLYNEGKSAQEIADKVKLSVSTVQSYLPAKRPYYNFNQSDNAKRIARWRANKEE